MKSLDVIKENTMANTKQLKLDELNIFVALDMLQEKVGKNIKEVRVNVSSYRLLAIARKALLLVPEIKVELRPVLSLHTWLVANEDTILYFHDK